MILLVLFIVSMFLWFLTILPHPTMAQFAQGSNYLAFISVLLLGLHLFVPALRG